MSDKLIILADCLRLPNFALLWLSRVIESVPYIPHLAVADALRSVIERGVATNK